MAKPKKHPHLESPSLQQIEALLAARSEPVIEVYLLTHSLILDALPDVGWSTDEVDGATGYGVHQYGYGGWGMAALMAHTAWATLAFMKGAHMDDPNGLLEGAGKDVRHVKLRSPTRLDDRADALRLLVLQAPGHGR